MAPSGVYATLCYLFLVKLLSLHLHVMRRHLIYCMFLWVVFVGHAGNKIDEVWQQISPSGVVGTGQNFASSYRGGGLVYPSTQTIE